MGAYDNIYSGRSIWLSILGYVVGFAFSFGIVYWIDIAISLVRNRIVAIQ